MTNRSGESRRADAFREPPHSLDAEHAVLGGLMHDARALPKISDWLTEEDFHRKSHRLIYRAIRDLADKSKPYDAVTMGDWFEENGLAEMVGGVDYVLKLANSTPGAANIVAYAEIVREKAILRRLIDIGSDMAVAAFTPGKSSTDIVATSTHSLMGLTASSTHTGLVPAKQAMRHLFHEMTERHARKGPMIGLPTPWRGLNDLTKGLRKGALYIVGGRPSMGKSIVGENLATFAALRGHRTAVFSIEMTDQEYMGRACAAHGDIPHEWIEQPVDGEDSDVYWQRQAAIMQLIIESPLLVDATPDLTVEQFMARARRAHAQKPLELIVLDHMHDMRIDKRAEPRFEYGRIAQGAKTLAKELNCPVVLLSQLNRALATRTDKRPTLADLRESGELEQKADVVLFVHREEFFNRKTHLAGVVELIPAKGRNIKIGETIHLQNRYDRMRLDDWVGSLPSPPAELARGWGQQCHSSHSAQRG